MFADANIALTTTISNAADTSHTHIVKNMIALRLFANHNAAQAVEAIKLVDL